MDQNGGKPQIGNRILPAPEAGSAQRERGKPALRPYQLVAAARAKYPGRTVPIIARTGWTCAELSCGIAAAATPTGPYDLVSLLIGVNNQYRGYPLYEYRPEFRALLNQAIDYAGGRPERVVVLSIPDWGQMPFAENRDRAEIAR